MPPAIPRPVKEMNTTRMMAIGAVFVIAVQVLANAALGEAGRAESGIRMTELMFDPAGTEISGEWLELRNCGEATENVGGWTLSDQDAAAELVFPEMTLVPGQFVIVHSGAGENGTDASGAAHFYINRTTGVWNNPGDDALLTDSLGHVVDFFSYGNGTGLDSCPADGCWPHASLLPAEGMPLALADEPIGAWLPRVPSPGRANGAPAYSDDVLITGVCYAPDDSGEFARMANVGCAALDLSDWRLADFEGILSFPAGATLAPGQTAIVAENATKFWGAFGTWPEFAYSNMSQVDAGFGLTNDGDELVLADPWGMTVDLYVYGASEHVGVGWNGAPAGAPGSAIALGRRCT